MSNVKFFVKEGATRDPGLTRIRTNTVGPLSGVVVAVFLFACSPGGDEPADSSDVPGEQQPAGAVEQVESEAAAQPKSAAPEPLAGAAGQVQKATPAQPEPAAPQPPAAAAKQTDSVTPAQAEPTPQQPPAAAAQPSGIDAAVARNIDTLTAIPGVVNVDSATCNAAPCIRITVTRRTQSMLAKLPASIEGYPVMVAERSSGH
jgi:hypothetical protein